MAIEALSAGGALPGLCAVCRGWARSRVCAECVQRWAPHATRCRRCAIAVAAGIEVCGACLRAPPAFDHAVAAVDYAFPWDRLVQRLKFDAALDLAPALAALLADAVRVRGDAAPDLVLPVPLGARRLRERGFNQAWEIARRVARTLACAADPHALTRLRETAPQTALAHDARAANLRGAFALGPLARARVAGREVAVVDDVMTTGATAAEIAAVLRHAGARAVRVWVVARTPAH